MAAYVVQVRIEQVRPQRPVRRDRRARPVGPVAAVTADAMVDIDGAAPSRLGERWRRIVELWSQTTFYLFDADSWRR